MESGGSKRRVVVVGGGIAGSILARSIQFNADLTLIDPKEYLEIKWAQLRSKVEPSFAERAVVNYRDFFSNGRIITSTAINITENEVLTADGQHIGYDYLVIATGHSDNVPVSKTERLHYYDAENQKIQSARSILIVGGGPSGVELAGEISTDFPDKKVTLVHKGPRLLEYIGPKASDKGLSLLRSKKVDVKLQQSVDLKSASDGSQLYRTSTGESIKADCHFLCTRVPLSTAWLNETILKTNLDKDGRLKVDEYLRVKGRSNIFAIGDITDVPELKLGHAAIHHAYLVAKNLKLLMGGGKESKMSVYKPGPEVAMVSLGRKHAVAQFPFATVGGRIPGLIKSGDMFVGRTRKHLGLEP
ncbi:hypothetical protein E1A91_D13G264400v1 [Gossypium mustelinum]|uniref:FAD/NAD(P)-binding domain-containing protein n=1 Tax=Gossypium mustelinum TaxID=34275 RepID=A0A5D2S6V4_GOSMU|nr:hypothetical protein E1A91_D13G264400v1 [Gossypium mustelinum]